MKALKFLVVLLFVLNVVSFVFGFMLFEKRELLKGRTAKLEQAFLSLATLTENTFPESEKMHYPARDVDENIQSLVENPIVSTYWSEYRYDLERYAYETIDLRKRLWQLASYYRIDPVSLKPVRDINTGQKLTTGPGTMQEILDEVVSKSENQFNRLNETRAGLIKTRAELVDTVSDVNQRKKQLRYANTTVTEQKVEIAHLSNTVEKKDVQIVDLNQTVSEQANSISDYQQNVAVLEENISELYIEVEYLKGRIADLTNPDKDGKAWEMEAGSKGMVVGMNDDWNFVLIKMNSAFVEQYLDFQEERKDRPDLDVNKDLSIVKKDDGDIYVTKVRLTKVYPDRRMAIADVLPKWQQGSITVGDQVVKF